jgi:hypothetical protein
MENHFASYNVEIPREYHEASKIFCQTSGTQKNRKLAPFERHVDFWYFCFLYSLAAGLEPKRCEGVNITSASILSRDPHRIAHIQMAYIAETGTIDGLHEHKRVFDYAQQKANSAFPFVISILKDDDDPIYNVLDSVEALLSKID